MLARLRALRDRSPTLFEGLVLSALTQWPPSDETTKSYPKLTALTALGPINFSRRPDDGNVTQFGPSAELTLLSELMSAAREFGVLTAKIVADERDPARRMILFE